MTFYDRREYAELWQMWSKNDLGQINISLRSVRFTTNMEFEYSVNYRRTKQVGGKQYWQVG